MDCGYLKSKFENFENFDSKAVKRNLTEYCKARGVKQLLYLMDRLESTESEFEQGIDNSEVPRQVYIEMMEENPVVKISRWLANFDDSGISTSQRELRSVLRSVLLSCDFSD